MKIWRTETWRRDVDLAKPYVIATREVAAVTLFFVRIATDDGLYGLGSASPAQNVTGESADDCEAALSEAALAWLAGRDPRHLGTLCRRLADSTVTPAARAAVDMALHDLFARHLGVPLVDVLGRCHEALPTSVTIGIASTEEALADAEEHLGHGFSCLKVKVGLDLEEDTDRLARLRELAGPEVTIRVDANQGYGPAEARRFYRDTAHLDLELIEQPLPAAAIDQMRALPEEMRRRVAADESLLSEGDALALATEPAACGIWNLKLMKCGGVSPALAVARLAETAGIEMMWGCNDESAISIAAALHAAYASPATRYLDLDGSFDLGRDPARGGFVVDGGKLRILDAPGLGVELDRTAIG